MKIIITMDEGFAYFNIFAKTHRRYICISRGDKPLKLIDYKYVHKTHKSYNKSMFSNKWEESPKTKQKTKIGCFNQR